MHILPPFGQRPIVVKQYLNKTMDAIQGLWGYWDSQPVPAVQRPGVGIKTYGLELPVSQKGSELTGSVHVSPTVQTGWTFRPANPFRAASMASCSGWPISGELLSLSSMAARASAIRRASATASFSKRAATYAVRQTEEEVSVIEPSFRVATLRYRA